MTVYIGGHNGVDPTGAIVSGDGAEQSVCAMDNAGIALKAASATRAGLSALSEVSATAAVMPAGSGSLG